MKTIEISKSEERLLIVGLKALDKDLSFMVSEMKEGKAKSELKEMRLDITALINKLEK